MAIDLLGGLGRPLAIPAYRDYSFGNFVSTVGRWAHRVAVGWLVWELTHSTAWLGIASFADLAPSLIVPLAGGVVADRFGAVPLIRLTVTAGAIFAGILATLSFLDAVNVYVIVTLVALIGIAEAFAGPARISVVYAIVPRDVTSAAIALNTAIFNACRLLGPAIAGPIILASGVSAVFVVNSASYLIFLLTLLRVSSDRKPKPATSTNMLVEIMEALTAVRADAGVRFMMWLMAISGFLVRPVMEFLPAFATQVFHGGPGTVSTLLSTLGFGAMVAGLWLARRAELRGLTAIIVNAHLGTALAGVLFALIDQLWLAVAMFAAYGFFLPISNIGAQTLVQAVVGGHLRARVMSIYMIISFGMPALGALIEGQLATLFGLRTTLAVGCGLAALWWIWGRGRGKALAGELEREA